jgi:hypothetical protein
VTIDAAMPQTPGSVCFLFSGTVWMRLGRGIGDAWLVRTIVG